MEESRSYADPQPLGETMTGDIPARILRVDRY
jgi:hypothetical protein